MSNTRTPPDNPAAAPVSPQYADAYTVDAPPLEEAFLARLAGEMLGEQVFNQVPFASRSSLPTTEMTPVNLSTPPVATLQDPGAVDLGAFAAPSVPGAPVPGFPMPTAGLGGVPLPQLGLSGLELPGIDAPAPASVSNDSAPAAAGPGPGASDHQSFYFLDEAASQTGRPTETRPETAAKPERTTAQPAHGYDVMAIRRDFPILQERVHGKPLIWLDNAATTQKPYAVIDRISRFYEHENSNIHRGAHTLAARATDAYEAAREKTRTFLNAPDVKNIVFVRGTTEAINLVAQSFGRQNIGRDDEIILTTLEHHSNIVPWQLLAKETGARIKVVPVDNDGQLLLDEYQRLLSPRTRLVAVTQVSNALGTVNPVAAMVDMAHRYGARVLVDGAQAVSHMPVDVTAMDADFYVFSGHKVFGPTGIGALYGKSDVLDGMQPWQGGGNMITDVTFDRTIYAAPPARFEAGTGNIADAVGLGAALDYVMRIGMENIAAHEHDLLEYGTAGLRTIPGLRLVGTAREKAGVMSFVLDGHRTEDVGAALDREGIAVRSGHHCAQPALRRFGLEASVRPSLGLYNTRAELDALVDAVRRIARA